MKCECEICKNNIPFELPKEIVEAALKGDLVLFCGAGISTEGKSVLPYSFYTSIKEELGEKDNDIPFSSLMQKYCNQPNGRKKLLNKIRERFNYIHSFPELERQATSFHRELSEIHLIRTISQQIGIHILKNIVEQFQSLFLMILLFGMNIQGLF